MANLAIVNRSKNGAEFYVSGLNETVRYKNIHISVDGKRSPNLVTSWLSTVSASWTVSTLNCGTAYPVYWFIESSGGSTADGQGSFTTFACDTPIGDVGYISAGQDSVTAGNLNVNYGNSLNADYYRVRVIDTATFGIIRDTTETGRSVSFINIPFGQYIVQVWGARNDGSTGPTMERVVDMVNLNPTPGSPGTVSVTASTTDAGRLYVSWGSAYLASDYLVTLRTSAGGYVDSTSVVSTSVSFSGLIEGGSYYVIVVPRNSNGNGTSSSSTTIRMPIVNVRPNNWQWDSIKSSGSTMNITASEWNRFCGRIDEFLYYKKLGYGTYTSAYAGTSITANQYNQARLAISSMGAVPTVATKGERIYASQFNQIRDYLNTIT